MQLKISYGNLTHMVVVVVVSKAYIERMGSEKWITLRLRRKVKCGCYVKKFAHTLTHTQCVCLNPARVVISWHFIFMYGLWAHWGYWVSLFGSCCWAYIYLIQLCRWFGFMVRIWDFHRKFLCSDSKASRRKVQFFEGVDERRFEFSMIKIQTTRNYAIK